MAKSKERSEVEHLRAENRKLRSENKQLKKQVARSNKLANRYEDIDEKIQEIELEKDVRIAPEADRCPNCTGKLKEVSIGIRTLITCDSCNYRETKKHNG
jgi:uncharacterized protein with PIN domain